MSRTVKVAIIGGGAAGIAAGAKLRRAGFRDFTIFEQSDGIGGTWWDNTYPGSEVDIASYFYSFSFMDWDWSRTHATQPEIQAYMQATVDKFELAAHFRHLTRVESVRWRDESHDYELTLGSGEVVVYDAVITAIGFLNNPRYPEWPGLSEFPGKMFHSSRWDHGYDFSGKRVAVVGTGSTSSQITPSIAPLVDHLYVFQREPGWVLPKGDYDYPAPQRAKFRRSWFARKRERFRQFRGASKLTRGLWREGTALNDEFRERALAYLDEAVEDPATRAALTPDFPFGCKRTIQSSTFLPTFNRNNVTLVPHAVNRIDGSKVITADGQSIEVDTLIIATGFQAQRYLGTLDVYGRGGLDVQALWGDTPMAFVGSMVPEFPNLFMVYGPNTNGGGSGIFQIEQGVDLAVRMIQKLRRGATEVEVTARAYDKFNSWLGDYIEKRLTAQTHCHNYYFSPSGRNVTQWPGSHVLFWLLTRALPLFGVRARRRRTRAAVRPVQQRVSA